MNINEMGTKFTQETIRDEENNLLINLVPAHNGRVSVKIVFDGDSDLMLTVSEEEKKCVVQRTIMPDILIEDAFKGIKENKEDIRINPINEGEIPVIMKDFTIAEGYEITKNQLPRKFQPHCPPKFTAFTGHTADMDKATVDDPFVRNNITKLGDIYDYDPHRSGRKKRDTNCIFVEGTIGNSRAMPSHCHFVDHHCGCNHCGCPGEAYNFSCHRSSTRCTYLVIGCTVPGTSIQRPVCVWHMTMENLKCDACCMSTSCNNSHGVEKIRKCPGM